MKISLITTVFILFILLAAFCSISYSQIVINEFLAGNETINTDEDGEYEDWIELYNAGDAAVDLTGYTITDDPDEPDQWTFPDVTVQAKSFLLVWASKKDRQGAELHTNFSLKKGGEFVGLYMPDGTVIDTLTFGEQTDDISLARDPDGSGNFKLTTDPTPAAANHIVAPPTEIPDVVINELLASNDNINADEDGDYSDWIELYNNGTESVNLENFTITDDPDDKTQWRFPSVVLQPGHYLLVWASKKNKTGNELHTNFKLSAGGEFVGLYTSAGAVVDTVTFGEQTTDISLARIPNGTGTFVLTTNVTPGSQNQESAPPPTAELSFAPESGFFQGTIQVALATSIPGGQIRYTTDGSSVKATSSRYTSPISVHSTKVIRARVFVDGAPASDDISHFYVINFNGHLPVISLATDEENLYGRTGIFDHYEERGREWERSVSVNFLELNGSGFRINSGVRVHGGDSRKYPKKSMRLYFRSDYGESKLNYKMFDQKDITVFDKLIIHAGGTFDQIRDSKSWTLIMDPTNHFIFQEINGNMSASRPVLVYLNGEFWGIYHIRERIDNDYLEANKNVSDADLLEYELRETPTVKEGDLTEWNETWNFFKNNHLDNESNFNRAAELIDIENFTDYYIFQIYVNNWDWPQANNFFFRENAPSAKWEWILWDTDRSWSNTMDQMVEWALRDRVRKDITSRDRESYLFSTLMVRRLLENDNYKNYFINRFADLINSTLSPSHFLPVFNNKADEIEPDIPLECTRWNSTFSKWQSSINNVRSLISDRPDDIRDQLVDYFGLSGTATITLNVNIPDAGKIKINTLEKANFPWSGVYFKRNPITLTAIANTGYQFTGWSGASNSTDEEIDLNLNRNSTITANFAPAGPFIKISQPNGGENFLIGQITNPAKQFHQFS